MQVRLHLLMLTIAAFTFACGNDNGGDVLDGGTGGGDAALGDQGCRVEPNFTSLHNNMLSTNTCNAPGCHNAMAVGAVSGSLSFAGGKEASYMELVNEATFDTASALPNRVKANDAMNSFLFRK